MPAQAPEVEPRWPVLLALACVVALHFFLPETLSIGPKWLLISAFVALATLVSVLHARGDEEKAYVVGLVLMIAVTGSLTASLVLLVRSLPGHKVNPIPLLGSAASLWVSNVIVFAAWYWKLDAGGPYERRKALNHEDGAFLFPQMALREESPAKLDSWHPGFVDYLFLSFNTSTALSPTDTQVLSRWAKGLMMVQSLISLTIIVLLAARAVNVL
jgi:hypothetical protein